MIHPTLLFEGFTGEHSPIAHRFRLVSYVPQYEPAQAGINIILEPRCDCEQSTTMLLFVSSEILRHAEFGDFIHEISFILGTKSHDETFMGLRVGPDPEKPYYSIDPFAPDIDGPMCDDTACSWLDTSFDDDILEDSGDHSPSNDDG